MLPNKAYNLRINKFVASYIKNHNATQSAIAAGYSKKTADTQGSWLLNRPEVRLLLDKAMGKIQDKAEITVERLLSGLLKIAEADLRTAFDDKGNLKSVADFPDGLAGALSGVDIDDLDAWAQGEKIKIGETKKLKLSDRVRAYELIGKLLGLVVDKREHAGPRGIPLFPEKGPVFDWSGFNVEEMKMMLNHIRTTPERVPESDNGHNGNGGTNGS